MESSKVQIESEIKLFPYLDFFPKIHPSVFLASGVKIIGNVEIGKNSSVWYNTVIRGDVHYIKIGSMTNVQDCSMLHVTNGKYPLNIGDMVTIGHSVNLHGCTLEDRCFIGIGSIILDGAIIKEKAMVAAGAIITPNFIVPSGKLAAGIPAKITRDLTENEMSDFTDSAKRYMNYTKLTQKSLNR